MKRRERYPSASESGAGDFPDKGLDPKDRRAAVFGVLAVMGLAVLNQTIVVSALPAIGRDLGADDALAWIVSAYFIAGAAATPLFGKLSDIHGRRPILLIAIGLFAAGSLAAALSASLVTLVLARVVQGLGGGAFLSLAQTVLADAAPPRERPRLQVYTTTVFVIGSFAGPVLGGAVVDQWHWSAIFWFNLPVSAAALWLAYSGLGRLPSQRRPHRLDMIGAALAMAATVSLLGAISVETYGALLVGVSLALWVLFAWRTSVAREPFIPLTVLRNADVRGASAMSSLSGAASVGLSTYLPFYFQGVDGLSAGQAGLLLTPLLLGGAAGAVLAGRVILHMEHYKWLAISGALVSLLLALAYAALPGVMSVTWMRWTLFLFGASTGVAQPIATLCVQSVISATDRGAATASLNFARQMMAAIVVAGFGALMFSPDHATSHDRAGAVVTGFRLVAAAAAVVLAVALVAAWRLREAPLRMPREASGA